MVRRGEGMGEGRGDEVNGKTKHVIKYSICRCRWDILIRRYSGRLGAVFRETRIDHV